MPGSRLTRVIDWNFYFEFRRPTVLYTRLCGAGALARESSGSFCYLFVIV